MSQKVMDPEEAALFQLQARLLESLQACIRSGSYLIAVCHLNGTDMCLNRITECFPVEDFDQLVRLLEENLEQEADRCGALGSLSQPADGEEP